MPRVFYNPFFVFCKYNVIIQNRYILEDLKYEKYNRNKTPRLG